VENIRTRGGAIFAKGIITRNKKDLSGNFLPVVLIEFS